MKFSFKITFIVLSLSIFVLRAQENITTFGIQFRPLIPLSILKTDKATVSENNIDFSINAKESFNFGMVIRIGFTKSLSLETGINVIKRNFLIKIKDNIYNQEVTDLYGVTAYEIPVQGMVYVRLGKQTYMNGSAGLSFDMLPTDIFTYNQYYSHLSLRYNWVQTALNANVGYEYRTKKSGYWYLGVTLHRPFHALMLSGVEYTYKDVSELVNIPIQGNYLTLDLRYFFNEKPREKSQKK